MNFQTSFQTYYRDRKELISTKLGFSKEQIASFLVLEKELFPSSKSPHWEYTDLKEFVKDYALLGVEKNIVPPSIKKIDSDLLKEKLLFPLSESSIYLVFYDGVYLEKLSLIPKRFEDKITCSSIQEYKRSFLKMQEACLDKHYLYHLSCLECSDGTYIQIHENVEIVQPIYILCYQSKSDSILQTRGIYLDVSPNSSISVIIDTVAEKNIHYALNSFQVINVQQDASLTYYGLCRGANSGVHLSNTHVFVANRANYLHYDYTVSAKCSKSMVSIYLCGEGAHAGLFGVSILSDSMHADNTTYVEHLFPNSSSEQHYRYLLGDKSTGVFDGMIRIVKDAQNVVSKQYSHAVLLSPDAKMFSKPQLDIWADRVQSAHGATIGYLDEEQIFYLCSRNLSKQQARRLLLEAFISNITQKMSCKELRLPLQNLFLKKILSI